MPKLSIITPIYGVEKYIARCARSLFEQTLDDIEYIFVNDCTQDRSIEILNEVIKDYPKRSGQIKIINHEQNKGLPSARKTGVSVATGEYIINCDSDDWVEINAYKECLRVATENNSDIVFFDFDITDGYNHNHLSRKPNINNKFKLLKQLVSGQLMGSVCGCMVKSSLYDSHFIWPIESINEDLVQTIQLCNNSTRFDYVNKPLYHYFQNHNSISIASSKDKAVNQFIQAQSNISLIDNYLNDNKLIDFFKKELTARYMYQILKLAPYVNDKKVLALWNNTYKFANWRCLIDFSVPIKDRLVIFLANLKIFPIIYRLRHKNANNK